MSVDANGVLVGTPDQLVTGAGLTAPVGTALPDLTDVTKAAVTLNAAFEDFGYIDEGGITLSLDRSAEAVRDWGLNAVRRYLSEFSGKVSFTFLETSERSLALVVGDDHVKTVAATASDGKKVRVDFGAWLPEPRSWVFKVKDGDARVVVVLPDAVVTSISEVPIVANGAIKWQVDVECNADDAGRCVYVITDDGAVSA